MTIILNCACGKKLHAADELAGKRVKCPHCGAVLVAPGGAIEAGLASQAGDELTPADLSVARLKAIFDAAFMATEVDSDGDLRVEEVLGCYVMPTKSGERISLNTRFRARDGSTRQERLEFVNRFNDEIAVVRACVNQSGNFTFDYYVPVDGGISPRTLVLATKFFLRALASGIRSCDTDNVVA